MSIDAVMHTEFPTGYVVFFGTDGKVVMTPQSEEHSSTIRSMQIDSLALGRRREGHLRRLHRLPGRRELRSRFRDHAGGRRAAGQALRL